MISSFITGRVKLVILFAPPQEGVRFLSHRAFIWVRAIISIASPAFFRETWLNCPTSMLLAHMALQHKPLSTVSLHSPGKYFSGKELIIH